MRFLTFALASVPAWALASPATAATINADPSTFAAALGTLKPGDTLALAAGTYPALVVSGLNGTASAPITISGAANDATIIQGDANDNTVELVQSSFVVIEGLTIDSMGIDGVFGVSAKGGTGNVVHDITIEGCTFKGQTASQQTDGISTKTPTWGWVIRNNLIDGAGTGLYLGNSDGSDPFVNGLIEGNLIRNTIGYDGEIKFQAPWPSGTGLPTGATTTIVRNNVFIKNDQASPDGDRPNLYVGGLPASGPGSGNLYELYGNFFFHNPRESLLQFEGRVSVHDNVFVDANIAAIAVQENDLPVVLAHVYNNTLYTGTNGIRFTNAASQGDFVVGNLVFAASPIGGPIANGQDNITDTLANAAMYVNMPSMTLGAMDFYPNGPKATGPAMDLSSVSSEADYDKDFNGTPKGTFTYRGAYAGQGKNPGWPLGNGMKMGGSMGTGGTGSTSTGGGPSGGTGTTGASASSTTGAGGGGSSHGTSGCSCDVARSDDPAAGLGLVALATAAFGAARRRRRRQRRRRRGDLTTYDLGLVKCHGAGADRPPLRRPSDRARRAR